MSDICPLCGTITVMQDHRCEKIPKIEGSGSLTLPEAAPLNNTKAIRDFIADADEMAYGIMNRTGLRYHDAFMSAIKTLLTTLPEAPAVKPKAEPVISYNTCIHGLLKWDGCEKCKAEKETDLDLIDECLDLYSERIAHSSDANKDEREGCCFGHDTLIDAREALERLRGEPKAEPEKHPIPGFEIFARMREALKANEGWTFYLPDPLGPPGQPRSWDCNYCYRPKAEHRDDGRCPIKGCTLASPPSEAKP